MKKQLTISMIVIFALLATACGAIASAFPTEQAGRAPLMTAANPAPSAPSVAGETVSKDLGTTTDTVDRIVIKNASLSLAVTDPAAAMQSIASMAEGMGGYVVISNVYKTTPADGVELPAAEISVRIPAEKLDTALTQIKALVPDAKTDVLSENVSGQDVTKEYTDTDSRLNNLKAAEAQLVKIMGAATKTEDVMAVFRELTSVREQIDVLQGQLNYYKDAARLSAVSINLQAKEGLKPISVAGWQPGLEIQKALQALVKGLTMLVNLLIFLVIVFVPLGLIIGLPIYFIVRAVRRHRQTNKPVEPQTPAVTKK